ncbi:hypothetical protein HmCmsJML285_5079 (plasmid) [Escherichia coli]|nr:hypothetical protein ECN1_3135 [Escherichia coli N1]BCM40019.1 hypothetical protein HmCmsJML285_5079 [Escherichia coli]
MGFIFTRGRVTDKINEMHNFDVPKLKDYYSLPLGRMKML